MTGGAMLSVERLVACKSPRSIAARKLRQVLGSLSHYVHELSQCRSVGDVVAWTYYKAPAAFPLRRYPPVINVELTNNCNFACPHCPRDALNKNRSLGFMDVGTFRDIVDQSAGRADRFKLIGLGEPSLHPEIYTIMGILKANRIKTSMHTNGTLFERVPHDTILDWRVQEIVVSIDGIDARSFERLRLNGNYRRLCENLDAFNARRAAWRGPVPLIEVRHVIMPNETPEQLDEFARSWRARRADTVKYCFLGEPYDRPRVAAEKRPSCRDIRREMHVRYDGRTPLCGYEGHREWVGDLTKTKVEDVWLSARMNEVRRQHSEKNLSKLPFCKTCQFW
jgi:wyosine [tRNA(Phe)-imidazoG37] synthetase (radical SAM superfamily)